MRHKKIKSEIILILVSNVTLLIVFRSKLCEIIPLHYQPKTWQAYT